MNNHFDFLQEDYVINKELVSERIYEILMDEIIAGRILPETKLVESNLANQFRVSRSSVREALMKLENSGLVVKDSKSRIVRSLKEDEVTELYQLWKMVETFGVRMSCKVTTKDTINQLENVIIEMEKCLNDIEKYRELNLEFHRLLISSCPNKKIKDLHNQTITQVYWYTNLTIVSEYSPQSIKEHKQILKHFSLKETRELETILSKHIDDALHRINFSGGKISL